MTARKAGARLPSWRMVRSEAERDQEESAFTPPLRRVWAASPGILSVAFVDDEGECVDYCSSSDPFEAKVAGAHLRVVVDAALSAVPLLGGGEMHALEIYGTEHEILARRIDHQYLLVVLAVTGSLDVRVQAQVEVAVTELRREAGVAVPPWDPQAAPLQVELRQAVGWAYAPAAFMEQGRRVGVEDVLGMWTESGRAAGGELACFRVRTDEGVELTLAHDVSRNRWMRR